MKTAENLKNLPFTASVRHWGHKTSGVFEMEKTTKIRKSVVMDVSAGIYLKKDVELSADVLILTHKHSGWKMSRKLRAECNDISFKELVIEEDAFVGKKCILICVGRIGKGAIIGAGSVLTKDVPAYEIWAGNPACKIGERMDKV